MLPAVFVGLPVCLRRGLDDRESVSNSDWGTHHWQRFSLATADCLQRNVEGKHLQQEVSALHKVETFIQTGCGLENLLGAAVTVTPAWMGPWLQNLGPD